MNPLANHSDPDIRGTWPALLRAAKKARQLSIATNTPFIVVKDGKVVNLNARPKTRTRRQKNSNSARRYTRRELQ
jgi:hypothetical protein